MPVMVVGVEDIVGLRAVELLAARPGEVRAFVRAAQPGGEDAAGTIDPATVRALGCKVAHGFLDDEAHLETALEQVHTVLVLLGRPTDDPDVHLDRVATVVSAAIGAGCRRMVLLSDLAVADPAGNPWLEALAEAEAMVADAPLEGVVLRASLVVDLQDPLTRAIAAGAAGPDPSGSHWPVQAADVAVTAVLADAERDLDTALHVEVAVTGPDAVTTAELARLLATALPDSPPPPRLPAHALDLLTRAVPRPPDAIGQTGRSLEQLLPGAG